tara:strand:- start:165 stop:623 length:459 start_codon:yes stop_codon:yes gene_type:complete
MFAIISSGGKQYKVSENTVLTVNKLAGNPGDKITIDEVLFASDGKEFSLGDPQIKGAKVDAEIVKQDRDRKILVFKKKRRKNYRRMNGHRQDITFLKVTSMNIPGIKSKSSTVEKKVDVKAKQEETAVKTTPKKTVKKKTVVKKKTATKKDK